MQKQKTHNKKQINENDILNSVGSICRERRPRRSEERNTQKGITLIALIITIIILLILAVVSIRLVMNNGILGKAETATENYVVSEEKEQIQIGYSDYQMAKASGEANPELKVAGATVEGKESTGWTITFEKTGNVYQFNGTNISANGPWKQKENAEGETIIENGRTGQTLKIGDYVNYDPTEGATTTSVTSYSADNGYGDQTFKLASYKNAGYGWRVLGTENGKIQLISEEFIGPDEGGYTNSTYNRTYYYLKGQAGYINGINELNKISSIYGQGKGAEGARSITVEDVNKITGYNPASTGDGKSYGSGNMYEYGNKVTYFWDGTNYPYYEYGEGKSKKTGNLSYSHSNSFNWYDGLNWQSSAKSTTATTIERERITELTSTYYEYYPTTLTNSSSEDTKGISKESNEWKLLFENTGNGNYYWLASPYVFCHSGRAGFGLRLVGYEYVNDARGLFFSHGGDSYGYSYGVRPVVSLKFDIQIEKTDTNDGSTLEKACMIK